jgi:hypothetical protein
LDLDLADFISEISSLELELIFYKSSETDSLGSLLGIICRSGEESREIVLGIRFLGLGTYGEASSILGGDWRVINFEPRDFLTVSMLLRSRLITTSFEEVSTFAILYFRSFLMF